jgi:hypothetical protein
VPKEPGVFELDKIAARNFIVYGEDEHEADQAHADQNMQAMDSRHDIIKAEEQDLTVPLCQQFC